MSDGIIIGKIRKYPVQDEFQELGGLNLRDSVLILVILHLKLDGPNLNNLEFEGLCRSEAFRLAPVLSHASILMFPGMSMKSFYRPVIGQEEKY